MKTLTNEESKWEYNKQPPLNTKLLLLTHGNQCVIGPWKGEPIGYNGTYKAFCGLPARVREVEDMLGYR